MNSKEYLQRIISGQSKGVNLAGIAANRYLQSFGYGRRLGNYALLFTELKDGYRWAFIGGEGGLKITSQQYKKVMQAYEDLGMINATTTIPK